MTSSKSRHLKQQRGSIDELPSGALRVRVYAGLDPVSKKQHFLGDTIPAGPDAAAEAEKARVRLLNQLYERRHPRTNATVKQMLDRYFSEADLEYSAALTTAGTSRNTSSRS